MKNRIVIYETTCRRCGKTISTANRSLYGLDELKAKYDCICKDCTTEQEKQDMVNSIGAGILRKLS